MAEKDESMQESQQSQESGNNRWAWFWMIVSVLYGLSPVDVVPDVVPVAGWMDDVVGIGVSALNLLQSYTEQSNATLSAILKMLKKILLVGGLIIVAVLALIFVLVYKMVA